MAAPVLENGVNGTEGELWQKRRLYGTTNVPLREALVGRMRSAFFLGPTPVPSAEARIIRVCMHCQLAPPIEIDPR